MGTFIAVVRRFIPLFLRQWLGSRLHKLAAVEQISGLPVLALIPQIHNTGVDTPHLTVAERNSPSLCNPKSQLAESFRALRSSLLLSTAGKQPQVILMTSARPAEGKTTVCSHLADVFARENTRVLLMDADLRRPTVHRRFGLSGQVGLSDVLAGSVAFEDAIQRPPQLSNLDVLVSGPVPPFPAEMLRSSAMTALIEKVRGQYTHILMDSPPVLSVADSLVLAGHADAVVLIARRHEVNKSALLRARDLLVHSGAPLIGVALNAVDLK